MSRREDRDSDSRRRRSRFDREPSPKRSRRDGKPETEKVPSNANPVYGERTEPDERHRRRLADASLLKDPLGSDNIKADSQALIKDVDMRSHGESEATKHSSDPSEVPRSRSFFQHDERSHAGQGGRSSSRRTTSGRGWWKDSRDHPDGREPEKKSNNNSRREENSRKREDDNSIWRHDGFFEMEANPLPPPPPLSHKRPSFREQKVLGDAQSDDKFKTESSKPRNTDLPLPESETRDERNRHVSHNDRPEKASTRDRAWPYKRERYGGGGSGGNQFRGRESYNGRQAYNRSSNTRVEKWKHDLFDEANKSPSPKNDEDRRAKIEALLAS